MFIETVKIVNEKDKEGYCIINLCDLTEEDVLFDKKAEKKRRKEEKSKEGTEGEEE